MKDCDKNIEFSYIFVRVSVYHVCARINLYGWEMSQKLPGF